MPQAAQNILKHIYTEGVRFKNKKGEPSMAHLHEKLSQKELFNDILKSNTLIPQYPNTLINVHPSPLRRLLLMPPSYLLQKR